MGHVGTIGKGDPGETHTDWFKKLGPIVSYDGVMGVSVSSRLYVANIE